MVNKYSLKAGKESLGAFPQLHIQKQIEEQRLVVDIRRGFSLNHDRHFFEVKIGHDAHFEGFDEFVKSAPVKMQGHFGMAAGQKTRLPQTFGKTIGTIDAVDVQKAGFVFYRISFAAEIAVKIFRH